MVAATLAWRSMAGGATSMAALAPQLLAKPGADPATGAARKQPACTPAMLPAAGVAMAAPGRTVTVAHDGAAVRIGAGAVRGATRITALSLCATSLAPMDQGMANVTAGPRRGYRFLPHMTFGANLRITLPYDPALIPAGESAQDVQTFYYDVKQKRWQALRLVSVDPKADTITSLTNHFTDFVVATITAPDSPGVLNDNPTSIKDLVNAVTGVKGPNSYTYVSRLEYDKFDSRAFIDYGNGVTTSYYSGAQEHAPTHIGGDTYTYDADGNSR